MIDDLNGTAGAAELSFLLVILHMPNRLALGSRSGALCAVILSRVNVRYLISWEWDLVDLDNLIFYILRPLRQTGHGSSGQMDLRTQKWHSLHRNFDESGNVIECVIKG